MATAIPFVHPGWSGRNTLRRRLVQVACLAVFVALPLLDLFRFDFAAGRLHLGGAEIWLDEWMLLWLALMFGMWLIGALSLVLGRVYCAYACPQMVFTELAHDLDAVGRWAGRRLAATWSAAARQRLARSVSLVLLVVLSIAASVVFMGYFAPMGTVLSRLVALDVGLWVGVIGALTAILTFLDFAFVREGFCRSVCPYGLLQGMLEDGRSLHVAYSQESGPCIECKACLRVCPMAIDIREGAFQIECTRCGSCIDACDNVLGRLKRPRPSLLGFRLTPAADSGAGGLRFLGMDPKRLLVAASTLGFGVVLVVAVARRETVAFQLSPVYTEAAAAAPDVAESHFLLRAANRGKEPVTLAVRPEGLPADAEIAGLADGVVAPGTERRFELVVRVPVASTTSSVTPFQWVIAGGAVEERFAAALLARRHGA